MLHTVSLPVIRIIKVNSVEYNSFAENWIFFSAFAGSQNTPAPMEPSFNGSTSAGGTGSYPNPMSGPPGMFGSNTNSSQMNGGLTGLGHSVSGFPYSYGQYPSSATGFPYSSAPSVGVGVGFHPMHSTTYAYPTTSTAYSQGSYSQAGYLNNQVLDRLKNDRMDASSFGGYWTLQHTQVLFVCFVS